MADNLVLRHLVFWTITCAVFRGSEIQAQSTLSPSRSFLYSSFLSTSSSSASLSVSPSSTSSVFLMLPSQNQSSSSVFASQSTPISSNTVDSTALQPSSTVKQGSSPSSMTSAHAQPIPSNTVDTAALQPSSTVKQSSSPSVTTTPKSSGSNENDDLTTTEYILIACLGVFAIVLIILVILAIQVARLNKSVSNLKFAPSS